MELYKVFFGQLFSTAQTALMLPSIVRLKIANKLLEGPKTSTELSENTQMRPDRLHRVLCHLENFGFFSCDLSTEKWSNTPHSEALADQSLSSMTYMLSKMSMQQYFVTDQVICSDSTSFELLGLQPVFDEFQKDAELLAQFQSLMQLLTKSNFDQVIKGIDLESSSKILDVGGGDATLAIALAERYQDKQFGIFERAEVGEIAKKNIEKHGLDGRVEVLFGNFFENVALGYDTIVMKHIVHDWPDHTAEVILKNCRNSLQVGNKLVVIDAMKERNTPEYKDTVSLDINMLFNLNGKERSKAEFEELLGKTGFRLEKTANALYDTVIICLAV